MLTAVFEDVGGCSLGIAMAKGDFLRAFEKAGVGGWEGSACALCALVLSRSCSGCEGEAVCLVCIR